MKYYLLKTNVFPHEFADGESVILIAEEDESVEIQEENLEFCTTLVVRTSGNESVALEEFSSWWKTNTTGKYMLELLTEEIEHLNRARKEHVLGLSEGEWSLNDSFIAYVAGNVESEAYAREIVLESEFEVQ